MASKEFTRNELDSDISQNDVMMEIYLDMESPRRSPRSS